jgi:hypothetical protein
MLRRGFVNWTFFRDFSMNNLMDSDDRAQSAKYCGSLPEVVDCAHSFLQHKLPYWPRL